MYDFSEWAQINAQGFADVDCAECGYSARVEPDADDPCPECPHGRLTSPLVEEGLI